MTDIEVLKRHDFYKISARGHAGYGPAGSDIVCAAISILVTTLAQIVNDDNGVKLLGCELVEGDALVAFRVESSFTIKHKLEAICTGFEMLAENYPANVSLTYKGIDI